MAEVTSQSSLLGELEADTEIKTSAEKFYHKFVERPQDLSKADPDFIQRCDLVEGEFGKVGCVLLWNYPKVAKERIEEVDTEKNLLVLKVVDGDLMEEFKSFLTTVQVTPKQSEPGSMVKCHFKYEKIDEKVAQPENLLKQCVKALKYLDEMLLSEA